VNLALFDFDGTITTREMFPDFMRFSVAPRRLIAGKILLAPWIAGYRTGMVSGNGVRSRIVDFGFRGVSETSISEAGLAFARDVLPGVVRPVALDRIRWHQTQGDRVVVVSGSLDIYLSHWCEEMDVELICSRLETSDGRLTGRYLGAQCVGEEKVRRVREACELDAFDTVYAYGDTHEDREMLELADRKYFRWEEVV
jgi:phosphatidylglycerophosphatase C